MILYPNTEKELSMQDRRPLPPLRGWTVAELRELSENIESAIENAWMYGNDMLAIALDMDARKVDLYITMYERKEGRK